jgi:C4-dicarboxylate-specific signal transduction histidine kinase
MVANGVLAGAAGQRDNSRERSWASVRLTAWRQRLAGRLFVRYGEALAFVAAALVASLLLQRFFPYPFLFLFFAAVMAAAWFGGTGPGIFSVLLSTLAIDYFFVPPVYSLAINTADTSYFGACIACALVASWVCSSKKRDAEALRDARERLEVRVAQRTAELANSVADREKAQQALIQAQSELAHLSQVLTMGELTASIAHEVNQPLTAVVNYGNACLEWLSASPPNLAEARLAAETIVKDGTRAAAVLGRIRALFQKQPRSTEWLDMNTVIHELIALLRHEIAKQNVSVRTDLSADLPRVKADRVQLQQVLLNLMVNAMDATGGVAGRTREILVRSRRQGAAAIRVSVEDNGCGFSPDVAERIFDPFFTTKPHGTGMGLSISRSLIESHQGKLWAERRPEGGAAFQITLPVESGS